MLFGKPSEWTYASLVEVAKKGIDHLLRNGREFGETILIPIPDYLQQCTLMMKQADMSRCFKLSKATFQSTIQVIDVLGQFGFCAARYACWMNLKDTWSPSLKNNVKGHLKSQKNKGERVDFSSPLPYSNTPLHYSLKRKRGGD